MSSGEKRCWQSCAETAQALESLDYPRCQQLKKTFCNGNFFNDFFSKVAWSFPREA
jgi:hypothetical protein